MRTFPGTGSEAADQHNLEPLPLRVVVGSGWVVVYTVALVAYSGSAAVVGNVGFELQPVTLRNGASSFYTTRKLLVFRFGHDAHLLTQGLYGAAILRGVGVVLVPKTQLFAAKFTSLNRNAHRITCYIQAIDKCIVFASWGLSQGRIGYQHNLTPLPSKVVVSIGA
jgi:hypothetical protein